MSFTIMFGHYPLTTEKAVKDIIRSIAVEDEVQYGVHLDEMAALVDDEDFFDATKDQKPDPVIEELLTQHVPFCEIERGDDEHTLKQQIRKTRIKGNKNAATIPGEEDERVIDVDAYEPEATQKNTFTVNRAAYNMIRPGYTVVLYGPRRSGKSKLIKNICQRMRHCFEEVVVFTMTKASGEYFGYIPYCRVIEGLDEDLLEALIRYQMKMKAAETRGEDVGNYRLLVIIDDCMAEGLRYKRIFNQLFYNGRHNNITLIVSVQDVRGIAPSATINADLVCTFSLPDARGRDTIREKFCDYLTKDEFDNLYDSPHINKKYHIVFFDIAHRYNPLDKRISFGCVDPDREEKFIMGSRKMWLEDPKSTVQLKELGFAYMLEKDDWGIQKVKKKVKK